MGASFPPSLTASQIVTRAKISSGYYAACRTRSAPDGIIDDTTSNSLNSRMTCFAPASSSISGIVLAYPGFGLGVPEIDLPTTSNILITAAIEYPAGTFTPVYSNGSRTLTVTPGRTLAQFDPCDSVVVPAGATFYVKTYATWTAGHFWLATGCASRIIGDWTNRGTGLTDNTLTSTVLTPSSLAGGYGPFVYARLATPSAVLGIIGDSISQAYGPEFPDPVTNAIFLERAMHNAIPVINLSKAADSFASYMTRATGRHMALRDKITHLIVSYVRNDVFNGAASTTIQSELQAMIAPFLARGVKCYAVTCVPSTTSTDGWTTTTNQTLLSAPDEAIRQTYNTWLRLNWASIGLSGIFDWAHAIDPTDSGLWSVDGATNTGTGSAGWATLSGGTVASVAVALYQSGVTQGGSGYPVSTTVPCVVRPYPGDPGTGAAVHAVTNSSGVITSYVVDAPGSGYITPPMVAPMMPWTNNDGVHPSARGYNEIIYKTGISPAMFTI